MLNSSYDENVLILELDHGKVNALDLELLQALVEAFRRSAPAQPIVVTGAGRAFSAGVDLRRIIDDESEYTARFLVALSECFLSVFDHRGPVIAAINGPAIAGGCVLAAACDHRLISRGPIGLAEMNVGVPFPTAALEIMRGLLGPKASDLVLSARLLEPEGALNVGLVDEVVRPDELLPTAVGVARTLGAVTPEVFAHTKRQLQAPTRDRIEGKAPADDTVSQDLWASGDVRRAIEGFVTRLAEGGSRTRPHGTDGERPTARD